MQKRKKIIVVDDNVTNLTVCKNILKPFYEVYPAPSAEKLFALMEKILPELILLDVEMPELNGYEAARILKNNPDFREVPFIFLSARRDPESELEGLRLGALDYIFKPFVAALLLRRIETQLTLIEQKRKLNELNGSMQKTIVAKTGQIWKLQNAVLNIVADLVECRDEVTGGHVLRTQHYLRCLIGTLLEQGAYAEEIAAWNLDFVIPSSQLHDLGKIYISDAILNKPGKLDPAEYEIIKTHVSLGVAAIKRMEKMTEDHSFFLHAAAFAGAHHERWDGLGYPNGLREKEIPLEGRLMAVADVYDVLISVRPYKAALSPEAAARIIQGGRGTQFDPLLVDTFLRASEKFADIAKGAAP